MKADIKITNKEKNSKKISDILHRIKDLVIKRKFIFIPLITILVFSIYVILINVNDMKYEKYSEVTFVTPTQAVIFWKGNGNTLGHAKYGKDRLKRNNIEKQTSSTPSEIHVVIIDSIPDTGYYVSLHGENDNPFLFKKVIHVKYNNELENILDNVIEENE